MRKISVLDLRVLYYYVTGVTNWKNEIPKSSVLPSMRSDQK